MAADHIRVLDLFAGAGGLTAGFKAGSPRYKTIAAVEMDKAAAASFAESFGDDLVFAAPIQDWLQNGSAPKDADLVIGGPPCQGFSTLGKQDEADARNSLWQKYAETLVNVRPKYFVVENVAAFANSPEFKQFQSATERDGVLKDYSFDLQILNAADFGAPQARKRAIVIGHHRDMPKPNELVPTHGRTPSRDILPHVTVEEAFKGIPLEPDRDDVLNKNQVDRFGKVFPGPFSPRDLHWSRSYRQLSLDRFSKIPPGGNRFDLPDELLAPCWRAHRSGSGDVMGRLHLNRPSVTIRTEFFKPEKGRYLHPTADRAITHYEAAILQGFPAEHKFVGSRTAIARQIGNAVPIPLGQAIASHLLPYYS